MMAVSWCTLPPAISASTLSASCRLPLVLSTEAAVRKCGSIYLITANREATCPLSHFDLYAGQA